MQDFLNSTNFTQIFIALILIKFLLETYLKIRNLKSIDNNKDSVPPRFKDVVTEEEYKKSILYNTDRIKFQIFTALFGSVVLVIFTIGGLLNYLTQVVMDMTSSNVLGAVLLGLLLIIVEEIISIPISIYSTFVIEERHGFNKTTRKTFVTDIFKGLLISGSISSILYATVIFIIISAGDLWWIYAFAAVFTLQAIIFFLYPVLIMPLFNKFEPLDDEQFKKPIEKLLENKVELFVDETIKEDFSNLNLANESHYETEFLDLKLAVKVVESVDQAIEHIKLYSSGHTEAILTESTEAADLFTSSIDSSVLFVNSSTRFTDGEMFGFGAEIGISTQKLHVRGPMGLEALTSEKYVVKGNGQIRK